MVVHGSSKVNIYIYIYIYIFYFVFTLSSKYFNIFFFFFSFSSFPIYVFAPLSSLFTTICSLSLPTNLAVLADLACPATILTCPAAVLACLAAVLVAHPFRRPISPLIFGENFESFWDFRLDFFFFGANLRIFVLIQLVFEKCDGFWVLKIDLCCNLY